MCFWLNSIWKTAKVRWKRVKVRQKIAKVRWKRAEVSGFWFLDSGSEERFPLFFPSPLLSLCGVPGYIFRCKISRFVDRSRDVGKEKDDETGDKEKDQS